MLSGAQGRFLPVFQPAADLRRECRLASACCAGPPAFAAAVRLDRTLFVAGWEQLSGHPCREPAGAGGERRGVREGAKAAGPYRRRWAATAGPSAVRRPTALLPRADGHDRAYSSRRNRRYLRRRQIKHTIPEPKTQRANRRRRDSNDGRPTCFDRELCKCRNEVDRTINRLKNHRAVATRYDKMCLRLSRHRHDSRYPAVAPGVIPSGGVHNCWAHKLLWRTWARLSERCDGLWAWLAGCA